MSRAKEIRDWLVVVLFVLGWFGAAVLCLFALGGIYGAIAAGVYNVFKWLT